MPVGTVPVYEALERAGGRVENITWDLFKQVLIDQAEQVCTGPAWVPEMRSPAWHAVCVVLG